MTQPDRLRRLIRDCRAYRASAAIADAIDDLHHRNCGIGTPTGCDCEYGFQIARALASVDTLPKGQDAKLGLAGTEGSAVPKADAQEPTA